MFVRLSDGWEHGNSLRDMSYVCNQRGILQPGLEESAVVLGLLSAASHARDIKWAHYLKQNSQEKPDNDFVAPWSQRLFGR